MNIEELKTYLDDPAPEHAQVCFMYRQAIGKRQQAEARVKAAQVEINTAGAELNMAMGVERGLHEAVLALANPTPPIVPTDPQE